MNNKNFKSIKFKLIIILSLFLIFVFLILGLVNVAFFEKFYINKKISEFKHAYEAINDINSRVLIIDNKKFDYEKAKKEYRYILDVYSSKFNISMIIIDNNSGLTLMSSERAGEALINGYYELLFKDGDKCNILQNGASYKIFKYPYEDNNQSLEFVGYSNDDRTMVLMSTPISGLKENIKVINRFMIYIGLASLIMSGVLMSFISDRITKPIINLSKISKKISELDFSYSYIGDRNDEIGILGNNINIMSDKIREMILQLKEANKILKSDIERNEKIENARKEFIADISHELKTPLALIGGYAEGLNLGICDTEDEIKEYTKVIIDETVKMNKLVKQLLMLSELESEFEKLEKEEFSLSELLLNICKKYEILYKESKLSFKFDIKDNIIISADEFKIEEIINNYINNAINHVDDNGLINISLYNDDKGITLSVFNSGDFISDKDIANIWDKFYKADKSRSRLHGGSGIGLSIVRAIAKSHGYGYGVKNINKDMGGKYISGVEFYILI